jgi:hypothetical protein
MKKLILLFLIILSASGCAVQSRYVRYTDQEFISKPKYHTVGVYPESLRPPASERYTVIGRVETSGYLSDGITQDDLTDKAKDIARKKGADAIINVRVERVEYKGTYMVPGYVEHHYHHQHYHPPEYYPYQNTALTFRGELIIFTQNT